MQEALIQAYLLRRGFPHGFSTHEFTIFKRMDIATYKRYRDWVFEWVDELTRTLPPR